MYDLFIKEINHTFLTIIIALLPGTSDPPGRPRLYVVPPVPIVIPNAIEVELPFSMLELYGPNK